MGADTKWYVTIRKSYTEIVEIYAITKEDAHKKANALNDIISVENVKHWSEVEKESEI